MVRREAGGGAVAASDVGAAGQAGCDAFVGDDGARRDPLDVSLHAGVEDLAHSRGRGGGEGLA